MAINDTPDPYDYSSAYLGAKDRRRAFADLMLKQGTDASPVGHPLAAVARAIQGAMGGYLSYQGDQRDRALTNLQTQLPGLEDTPSATPSPVAAPAMPAPTGDTPAATLAGKLEPRGYRNNNPLNIEAGSFTGGQPGFAGSDGRFAKFGSMDQGVAAANKLLDTYQNKYGLNTPAGIIGRWAPPSENDTRGYAASVAGRMGITPDTPITPEMRPKLIAAMAQFEKGKPMPNMAFAAPQPQPFQVAQAGGGPIPMPQPRPQMPGDQPHPPGMPQPTPPVVPPQAGLTQGQPTGQPPAQAPMAPQQPMPQSKVAPQIPPAVGVYIKRLMATGDPGAQSQAMKLYNQYAGPRDQWITERNPDGSIYQRNLLTNEMKAIEKSDVLPDAAVKQKIDIASAGKPNTTINNTVNPVLKGIGDRYNAAMDAAETATPQIQAIHEARRALDSGAYTGALASEKLGMAKIGQLFGLKDDAVTNTEVLRSSVGNQVLEKAKTLGANPSNADRDYIEKVVGGKIELNEASMRRLLDMQEGWARSAVKRANAHSDRLLAAQPEEFKSVAPMMKVPEPVSYEDYVKQNPVKDTAPAAAPSAAQPVRVNSPEEARKLPKGTPIIMPDGQQGVVP